MKNLIITLGLSVVFAGFVGFSAPSGEHNTKPSTQQDITEITISDTVLVILEKSCLPCHGIDGKSKAKMKWSYEKMPDMKTSKRVSKLAKIVSVLEKDKMPSAKFVKKYPDKALTPEEKQILIGWAEGEAEKLTR